MRTILLFQPDSDQELCKPDPLDKAARPRRHYEELGDDADVVVFWREWGDGFEGGYRDHLFGQGVWENVTIGQFTDAIASLDAFEEPV